MGGQRAGCRLGGPLLASTDLPAWADAIRGQREGLVESLRHRGLEVADTEACWVLVEEPHLRERLARQGEVVRDCASFGLDGVARIAVPDDAGLARLLHALDAAGAGR